MAPQDADTTDETPIATFAATDAPGWTWEVLEVETEDADVVLGVEDGEPIVAYTTIYFGRVKSPFTHGRWEYGTFTKRDLRQAGATRTDGRDGWP